MRADSDALSPRSVASVQRFASELTSAITVGITSAVDRGELSPVTPIEDVVALLVNIINSAGLVTQDAARFDQLELIYRAFLRTVVAAYGHQDSQAVPGSAKRPFAARPGRTTSGAQSAAVARRRRKQL
jgi:hypothetical protein